MSGILIVGFKFGSGKVIGNDMMALHSIVADGLCLFVWMEPERS